MRLPPGHRPGTRLGAYSAPKPPAGEGWVTPAPPPPFSHIPGSVTEM